MNKLSLKLGVFTVAMGIGIYGWADNPCMPIAKACMQLGYYKGGVKEGKGLIENCVIPVANNQKTLTNATFSSTVLQQCNAKIMAKMKGN